jgi:hypothetical protein
MGRGVVLAVMACGVVGAMAMMGEDRISVAPASAQLFRENDQVCGHTVMAPQILATELIRDGKLQKLSEDPLLVTMAQQDTNRVWVFTKPGHAAHPSVVCRRISKSDNGFTVDSEYVCKAARSVCSGFGLELRKENEAIRRAGLAS